MPLPIFHTSYFTDTYHLQTLFILQTLPILQSLPILQTLPIYRHVLFYRQCQHNSWAMMGVRVILQVVLVAVVSLHLTTALRIATQGETNGTRNCFILGSIRQYAKGKLISLNCYELGPL